VPALPFQVGRSSCSSGMSAKRNQVPGAAAQAAPLATAARNNKLTETDTAWQDHGASLKRYCPQVPFFTRESIHGSASRICVLVRAVRLLVDSGNCRGEVSTLHFGSE